MLYNQHDNVEIWQPHPDYTEYLISIFGNVYRRAGPGRDGRWFRGHHLNPPRDNHGYRRVVIFSGGRKRGLHRRVGSLVLETFVGPRPEGYVVCHGPNGSHDDRLSELCWGTQQKNIADKRRDGTDNQGERNGRAKLTVAAVRKIRTLYHTGRYTQKQLAQLFHVKHVSVHLIVRHKTWKHIK